MIRNTTALLASLLLMLSVTAAQAAPFDELQGQWVGEIPDVPAEIGEATLHLDFVDEDTVIITAIFGEEKETMEMRYEATDDQITIYEDDNAEGEVAAWEITDDGILIISPEDEEAIEFHRPSDSDSDE